jgi:hypothetical protein
MSRLLIFVDFLGDPQSHRKELSSFCLQSGLVGHGLLPTAKKKLESVVGLLIERSNSVKEIQSEVTSGNI